MTRLRSMAAFGVIAVLAACGGMVTGPEGWRQAGVLMVSEWSGTMPVNGGYADSLDWSRPRRSSDLSAPDVLVAPDTVDAGEAFEVWTHTVGLNGCWRSDGQTSAIFGLVVVVKPYDAHSGAEVCTEALSFLAHGSTLVLNEPGEWTLRVDGRRVRLGNAVEDEPVSAEKTVVVR